MSILTVVLEDNTRSDRPVDRGERAPLACKVAELEGGEVRRTRVVKRARCAGDGLREAFGLRRSTSVG
jgi:hypothetical protein